MTRRAGLLVVASLLLSWVATAAEPPPSALVRARLEPSGEVWVGQRVTLDLELLAQGTFASAPAFDLPQAPGVLLIPPTGRPVLGAETVGGADYTSQLHHLVVFPQRAGTIAIPPIGVRFAASPTPGAPPADLRVTTGSLTLRARMPPGAERLGTIISSSGLTLQESWQPPPGATARVGDAFTRTLRLQAPDVPGMAFPLIPPVPVAGVGVYPQSPEVNDRAERGRFSGERVERVTYVLQQPGPVTLPGVALTWWNLEEHRLVVARLPARDLDVGPAAAAGAAPVQPRARTWQLLSLPLAAVGLGLLTALAVGWAARRHPHRSPEAAAFAGLQAACRRGDPREAYRALLAWLPTLEAGPASLADLATMTGDPALVVSVASLERALFGGVGPPAPWSAGDLPGRLRAARRRLSRRRHRPRAVTALAPLNPAPSHPGPDSIRLGGSMR